MLKSEALPSSYGPVSDRLGRESGCVRAVGDGGQEASRVGLIP